LNSVLNTYKINHFNDIQSISSDANRILTVQNAGGNSFVSEAMSFEVLSGIIPDIKLTRTEMDINYVFSTSPKIDYIVQSFSGLIGVSVTRAMNTKIGLRYPQAKKLLQKKINGLLKARQFTCNEWNCNLLHVFVMRRDAHKVRRALNSIGNFQGVQIMVTVLKRSQSWIMDNIM
jgi:hypothetical protein